MICIHNVTTSTYFLSTMQAFNCGYFMSAGYIDQFVMGERDDDEDLLLAILRDFNMWWLDLPIDKRKRIPIIDCSFCPNFLHVR